MVYCEYKCTVNTTNEYSNNNSLIFSSEYMEIDIWNDFQQFSVYSRAIQWFCIKYFAYWIL